MQSLPAHVGRKLSFGSGWFIEDGKGNLEQQSLQKQKVKYLAPQPIEPKWKPTEPKYEFKFFS